MRSGSRRAGVAMAFLGFALACYGGCADRPYVGGSCEANTDCESRYQNVPGTGCVNGSCQCVDPSHTICCGPGETPEDCFLACRPCAECAAGTEGCSSPPGTGCQSDAECPGPSDAQCGVGRCVQGACTLEIKPGPLASQIRGDCQRAECTMTGEITILPDPSDFYDDGEQCTADLCDGTTPRHQNLADGTTCPVSGAGRCLAGTCVDCFSGDPGMNDCPAGLACDYTTCVPVYCMNGIFDPASGETANDCGGACRPCEIGEPCATGADCKTSSCAGVCKAPTCQDGVENDAETGVDCGAPSSCPLCSPGQGCEAAGDCSSAICWAGVCEAPSCFDGVRNGEEAGVDCGPACSVACP